MVSGAGLYSSPCRRRRGFSHHHHHHHHHHHRQHHRHRHHHNDHIPKAISLMSIFHRKEKEAIKGEKAWQETIKAWSQGEIKNSLKEKQAEAKNINGNCLLKEKQAQKKHQW